MPTSPTKPGVTLLPNNSTSSLIPPSPRSTRTIRRLQSAHTLSSHVVPQNPPPFPSHQLLQQQSYQHLPQAQQSQHAQRTPSSSRRDLHTSIAPPSHQTPAYARTRSNSDLGATNLSAPATRSLGPRKASFLRRTPASGATASKGVTLDGLVRDGPLSGNVAAALREMRYLILTDGVLSDGDGMSSLRIYIWLILLSAPPLATDDYLALIHRGPSPAYSKIRNDTFRTLATDPLFRRRVSEASLIRLLNAVAWRLHDAKEERMAQQSHSQRNSLANTATSDGSPELQPASIAVLSSGKHTRRGALTSTTDGSEAGGAEPGTYVQGMNVLAAPFLYAARSEAEAFVAFSSFLTHECPGYVRGAMDGVHRGLALVDKVLQIVDPKLSAYLLSKGMHAELYAFPSVLTLCACTPPLPEVLHLWDLLFAYGAHLNVLCIVAQLIMIRDTILSSPSPTKILRSFPPLQAAKIKMIAISLVRKIPATVYDEIIVHAK